MRHAKSTFTGESAAKAYSPNGACPKGYSSTTTGNNIFYKPPCTVSGCATYGCNLNNGLSNQGLRIDTNVPIVVGGFFDTDTTKPYILRGIFFESLFDYNNFNSYQAYTGSPK